MVNSIHEDDKLEVCHGITLIKETFADEGNLRGPFNNYVTLGGWWVGLVVFRDVTWKEEGGGSFWKMSRKIFFRWLLFFVQNKGDTVIRIFWKIQSKKAKRIIVLCLICRILVYSPCKSNVSKHYLILNFWRGEVCLA